MLPQNCVSAYLHKMAKIGPQGNVSGRAQKECSQQSLMNYFKPKELASRPLTSQTVVTPGYYGINLHTEADINSVVGLQRILEPTRMTKHMKYVLIRPSEHILGVDLLSKGLYTPRGPFTKHTWNAGGGASRSSKEHLWWWSCHISKIYSLKQFRTDTAMLRISHQPPLLNMQNF